MKKIMWWWLIGIVMLMLSVSSAMATHITHNASSVTLTTGTWDAGNVTSTWVKGDAGINNTYNWSGVGGVPGFDVRFNVSDVTENRNSYLLAFYATGSGGVHIIRIEAFNFTSGAWDIIGTAPEFIGYDWANRSVYSQDYINGNEMWIRAYHADSGNAAEDFAIDYFQIIESDTAATPLQEYLPMVCPIDTIPSTMLYIFIGVVLIGLCLFASHVSVLFWSIVVGTIGFLYALPLYGCNVWYAIAVQLSFVFYVSYEAFYRKFTGK